MILGNCLVSRYLRCGAACRNSLQTQGGDVPLIVKTVDGLAEEKYRISFV